MAYDKTITDADAYFATHAKSYDWTQFTVTERTAVLTQAQRELELFMDRDLYNPADNDRYRDDYACFEQTLFILEKTVRTRQSETSAELVETADTEQRDKYYGVTISPMAQRFLAKQRVKFVRG